ncbi:MAG: hypothetical protein COB53_06210 [Elusimicrobia bacterium]|nr:MAG: hypothetical protein COB53_06210 [Elusimicrobiota bacterium]
MVIRRSHVLRKHSNNMKIPQDEVSFLFDRLESEEHAEEVWKDMIAAPPDEGVDFGVVEEHFLKQPHEHNSSLRRWKYFGK